MYEQTDEQTGENREERETARNKGKQMSAEYWRLGWNPKAFLLCK